MRNSGIHSYFNPTLFDSEMRVKKPNPIIFNLALNRADAKPHTFFNDKAIS